MNSPDTLGLAYDILVEECGAHPGNKSMFLSNTSLNPTWTEWRFQGKLGFGGKIWQAHWPKYRLYVTCYTEDETQERREMMAKANARLANLTDGRED